MTRRNYFGPNAEPWEPSPPNETHTVDLGGSAAPLPRRLTIGAKEQAAIDAVIERARAKPQRWDMMAQAAAQFSEPPRFLSMRDKEKMYVVKQSLLNVVRIPDGFECCFRYEETPSGWQRHLSVSVDNPGKHPGQEAMVELAKAFGFTAWHGHWLEEFAPGRDAVHVVELIPNDKPQ